MLGWTRTARGLITVVGLTMTLYHLYTAWFGAPDALSFRAVHVAFALVLAFLIVPGRGGETDDPGVLQLILAGLSVIACGYLLWAQDSVANRLISVDVLVTADWLLGGLLILLLLDLIRRLVEAALPLTAAPRLLY